MFKLYGQQLSQMLNDEAERRDEANRRAEAYMRQNWGRSHGVEIVIMMSSSLFVSYLIHTLIVSDIFSRIIWSNQNELNFRFIFPYFASVYVETNVTLPVNG